MKTPEELAYQRQYRKRTGNICTYRYEKSPKGFLMRTYRNMQSRVTGIQWKKAHLYAGLELLPRKDFYEWSLNDSTFWDLYNNWKASNYERKLSPSINRKNPKFGYTAENVEWVTHSENSRLGSISQWEKKHVTA